MSSRCAAARKLTRLKNGSVSLVGLVLRVMTTKLISWSSGLGPLGGKDLREVRVGCRYHLSRLPAELRVLQQALGAVDALGEQMAEGRRATALLDVDQPPGTVILTR